jgi:ATP synthase protein I
MASDDAGHEERNRPSPDGKPGNVTDDFGTRLAAAKARAQVRQASEDQGGQQGSLRGYAWAFRLASEFFAGIVVGGMIGWLIDRFAGTSPWGLIVFLLVGFAAGVLNVVRGAAAYGPGTGGDSSGGQRGAP